VRSTESGPQQPQCVARGGAGRQAPPLVRAVHRTLREVTCITHAIPMICDTDGRTKARPVRERKKSCRHRASRRAVLGVF